MSLSDHLRHRRAIKGGATPWEIAEATGLQAGEIHLLEVKHRRVGEDDAALEKLARYFGVPVTELMSRREAFRKRLTAFLDECRHEDCDLIFKLENGEEIGGALLWYGHEAACVRPADGSASGGEVVVERGWVADWRRSNSDNWEVAGEVGTG